MLAAFDEALAVLEHPDAASIDDRPYLLAVVWMNLASVAGVAGHHESDARAVAAAMQAIGLVAGDGS